MSLKAPETALPPQVKHLLSPRLDDDNDQVCWTLLLLYPQYGKLDVIQTAYQADMLAEYLAMVLPEEGTSAKKDDLSSLD